MLLPDWLPHDLGVKLWYCSVPIILVINHPYSAIKRGIFGVLMGVKKLLIYIIVVPLFVALVTLLGSKGIVYLMARSIDVEFKL